jgi:hypothetical protein
MISSKGRKIMYLAVAAECRAHEWNKPNVFDLVQTSQPQPLYNNAKLYYRNR